MGVELMSHAQMFEVVAHALAPCIGGEEMLLARIVISFVRERVAASCPSDMLHEVLVQGGRAAALAPEQQHKWCEMRAHAKRATMVHLVLTIIAAERAYVCTPRLVEFDRWGAIWSHPRHEWCGQSIHSHMSHTTTTTLTTTTQTVVTYHHLLLCEYGLEKMSRGRGDRTIRLWVPVQE